MKITGTVASRPYSIDAPTLADARAAMSEAAASGVLPIDRATRSEIDALGAALGVDTTKGKKADALKTLRSFDDTGNLTRPT